MKKTILTLCLTLLSLAIKAQNQTISLDVNGLILGEQYTDVQIRNALGEPFFFEQSVSDSGGDARWYMFGNEEQYDRVSYDEDFGGINEINITRPNFRLFGDKIQIGDNISAIQELGVTLKKQLALKTLETDGAKYIMNPLSDYCFISIYVDKNDKIVRIYMTIRT